MKISEALGVSSSSLWKQGVFDSYIGIDSRLHIDPALLRRTRIPEFKDAFKVFNNYFAGVLALITQAQPGSILERQAIRKLIFPEIPIAALGYAKESTSGRGVTLSLAKQLYRTAREVIEAGIKDPAIFELAVVFEEGFGADLISDMTLVVILNLVESFNLRVCQKLGIQTKKVFQKRLGRQIQSAYSTKKQQSILLIPYSLLSDLPEALDRDDIDRVVMHNAVVREHLNQLLGSNWTNLVKRMTKNQIRSIFIENPSILKSLLQSYKKRTPQAYDFDKDHLGEVIWESLGVEAAQTSPLKLNPPHTLDELAAVVLKVSKHFKKLVEINGQAELLFDDSGRHRHEKFAQLLFYAVADTYCKANNLDLSREPNAGRGPVDFKLSKGQARCLVEIKLSSNSRALDGLAAQLPEYAKAEEAKAKIFLLIVTGPNAKRISKIEQLHAKLKKKDRFAPKLVIVEAYEAYHRPSASHLF